VNEIWLQDIRSQPAMLAESIPDMRNQAAAVAGEAGRVVLTGSGDSLIAPLAVELLYRTRLDVSVRALTALDASRFEPLVDTTLVVVSVSGSVSRAIEIATRARQAGAKTIAITANVDSELARLCDATVAMPPPIDRALPHARDFTATLAALIAILEALVGERFVELDIWAESAGDLIDQSFEWATNLESQDSLTWFLGAGPGRASAMYGALKFWEAGGMEAWWDDLEEFAHGSQLMARPGQRVFLLASGAATGRAVEMVPGFEQMGMIPVVVSDGVVPGPGITLPRLDTDGWFPLAACFPLQALTYVDAMRRGIDAMVPLGGRPFGATFLDVHVEWTKRSAIVDRPDTRQAPAS
jgi:fructoselysine-6-P-deglycase FrlB-like protein